MSILATIVNALLILGVKFSYSFPAVSRISMIETAGKVRAPQIKKITNFLNDFHYELTNFRIISN